jgi:hypothetical protein
MTDIKKIVYNVLGIFNAVHTINERYKHPKIQMTPMVKISLLALRLYLFAILTILLFKFISVAFLGDI